MFAQPAVVSQRSDQLLRPALGLRPWFAFDRRALARRLLVRLDMAPNTTGRVRRTRPRGHTGCVLLVYDGECGFCVRSARWIEARLPAEARVEPWQSLELDDLGLSQPDVEASVWWLEDRDRGRRHSRGADAIGRCLVASGGLWRIAGYLIVHPPLAWVARPVYALVAANRHRLPGSPANDR